MALLIWELSGCANRPIAVAPAATPSIEVSTNASTIPSPAPSALLALQGQLSVKLQAFQDQAARGINLGFFFSGNPQGGQLDLMTPLGSQVAQVRWTEAGAWLQTDKGERLFTSLLDLSEQVLGEALPLSALMSWAQGRPDPALPAPSHITDQTFEQSGWLIDTKDVSIGRVMAQRPTTDTQRGITMRVRLD